MVTNTEGPSTQIIRFQVPKIHTLNGFWTLEPYYLGTWTLSKELYYESFRLLDQPRLQKSPDPDNPQSLPEAEAV